MNLLLLIVLAWQQTIAPPPRVPEPGAPNSAAGTAAISGLVFDATTKAPLADALVYLSLQGRGTVGPQSRQLTDDKGRFAFVNLPAGTLYAVSASRFGYLDGGFAQEGAPVGPSGSMGLIALQDGEWAADVRVPMWRPGAIAGIVTDERGEPVAGVYVRALVRVPIQRTDEIAAGPLTTTDDRGMFRIAGLPAGRYVVQVPSVQAAAPAGTSLGATETALHDASDARLVIGRYPIPPPPVNGRAQAYPIAFHPAAATIDQATVIDLEHGEERSSVDVKLDPVPAFRVSGRVDGPVEALTRLTLRLLPAGLERLGHGSEAATALVGADGRFQFLNVPAGSYTLDAPRVTTELSTAFSNLGQRMANTMLPPYPGQSGWSGYRETVDTAPPGTMISTTSFRSDAAQFSGRAPLVVSGSDITDVTLTMQALGSVTGRIVVEADATGSSAPTPARWSVRLDPAGSRSIVTVGRSDSQLAAADPLSFAIVGVTPGRYFLRLPSQPGWLVKSVQWNGRDYSHSPIDAAGALSDVVITVTNALPTLSGVVRDRDGAPAPGSVVIAFPIDRAQWTGYGFFPDRIKTVVAGSSGAYRFGNLPAGDYYVTSVPASRATAWLQPGFFAEAERLATRVTISWGRETTQDLAVAPAR
jgi:hypothetical protein